MKRKEKQSEFSLLIMTAFFLMSFLLLVIFGTGVYRSISLSRQRSSFSRVLSSYLHTASKMNEAGIYVERKEGRDVLVIKDGDTGFGNRIYLNEGYLSEDFGKLDDELHPSSALKIAKTSLFLIEEIGGDLLKITTDEGVVYITRMEGGGR